MKRKLKKDQLVPSSQKKVDSNKRPIIKSRGAKAKKTHEVKDNLEALEKKKTVKKSVKKPAPAKAKKETVTPKVKASKTKRITDKIDNDSNLRPDNYISKEVYEERLRLRAKFDEELKEFSGRKIQLISFKLGEDKYALEISKVKEVVATPGISKIPHTPNYIKGVGNIRGEIMAILDLETKFRLTAGIEGGIADSGYTLVIEDDSYKMGVLVSEVPSTLIIEGDIVQSSSGIISNAALNETYIKGLIKTDQETIMLLDVIELIRSDEIRAIAEAAVH